MRSGSTAGGFLILVSACGPSSPGAASPPGPSDVAAASATVPDALPASNANDGGTGPAAPSAARQHANPEVVAEDDPCVPAGQSFEKKVRPDFKNCYRDGKKKDPSLEGSAKFVVNVDAKGKVVSVKSLDDKSTLGAAVVQCMFTAVKKATFDDAAKCQGKSVLIPVEFPTK